MIFIFYFSILFLFTLYSYSQIDLNLTLSSNFIYQQFQKQMIELGYFHRFLSTSIYLFLLFFLFLFYFLFLRLVKQQKLLKIHLIWLILLMCGILLFSYPAFSHDIFNYIFDARIVTKYHLNPYSHSALDFPYDSWTRFMHWTHRVYPYGPIWLLITLPFSFFGFSKFVFTLFNFKLMFTLFYLGNAYLIYKISQKFFPKLTLLNVTFYTFNPLVIIESLISPHNEVVVLFFLLLAIYLVFFKKKRFFGTLSLLLSGGIKFTTLIIFPFFFVKKIGKLNLIKIDNFLKLISIILFALFFLQIYYREAYSWYLIPILGVMTFFSQNQDLKIFLTGLSLGLLLRYLPYLYYGDYSFSVRLQQNFLLGISLIFALSWILVGKIIKKRML